MRPTEWGAQDKPLHSAAYRLGASGEAAAQCGLQGGVEVVAQPVLSLFEMIARPFAVERTPATGFVFMHPGFASGSMEARDSTEQGWLAVVQLDAASAVLQHRGTSELVRWEGCHMCNKSQKEPWCWSVG